MTALEQRRPTASLTFLGLNVHNAPGMDLSPDVRSAIMLAVTVPTGIWLVLRAMRPMS